MVARSIKGALNASFVLNWNTFFKRTCRCSDDGSENEIEDIRGEGGLPLSLTLEFLIKIWGPEVKNYRAIRTRHMQGLKDNWQGKLGDFIEIYTNYL